jgi:ribosomal protein S18 acetylase RimI-like enzyme
MAGDEMSAGSGVRIVGRQGLRPGELGAIRDLAALCNGADGLDLKLSWEQIEGRAPGETSDFCAYIGGLLVGYAALDGLLPEFELTGMVRPEYRRRGIFRALVGAARDECRRRGAERLLLVCERASAAGRAFVAAIGGRYAFAEYHLELEACAGVPTVEGEMALHRVASADLDQLAQLNARAFGRSADEARARLAAQVAEPGSRYYIASTGGEAIGLIGAIEELGQVYLRGIGIVPEVQGRGHGRRMLVATIRALLAEGHTQFALDVESDNAPALALYRACGFREANAYEYYELSLASSASL